ncbi:hypothetical protein [Pseudaestuariivita rosea]|uniref:hypothetical protein n=1 Tax=Pseudaestuariivita rosea TaxID=2763263 RepID=UPI001ABA2CF2|nr:hypothetical protein [Pseudaestuariivita rosea]
MTSQVKTADALCLKHPFLRFLSDGLPTTFFKAQAHSRQFAGIFLLKPEVCRAGFDITLSVVEELERKASSNKIYITDVVGFGGRTFEVFSAFDRIYNKVARFARFNLPADTLSPKLTAASTSFFERAVPVVGGATLVQKGFEPSDIQKYWSSAAEIVRIEADCYAAPLEIHGQPHLLLNGFYPYKRAEFQSGDARIIAVVFETNDDFEACKPAIQGDADPRTRSSGSMRGFISRRLEEAGYPALSTTVNGLHMSSDPLAGRLEVEVIMDMLKEEEP